MSISLLDAVRGLQSTPSNTEQTIQPTNSHEFSAALERLLGGAGVEKGEALGDLDEITLDETEANTGEVKFSKHAKARLQSRDIDLDQEQLAKLSEGIDSLAERGARESLVLMGDTALVVGVPKRTVITAMTKSEAMGNIFTNIDSTLVIE